MIYQDANVKVTAAENTHFNFPPGTPAYGNTSPYAYRFEAPTESSYLQVIPASPDFFRCDVFLFLMGRD